MTAHNQKLGVNYSSANGEFKTQYNPLFEKSAYKKFI